MIQNSKFKIRNFRAIFRLTGLLCVFCALAGSSSAQDEEPQISRNYVDQVSAEVYKLSLAAALQKGTVEEKRSALFEIRNRRAEDFSRLAAPALIDPSEIVRATAAAAVIFLPRSEAFNALAPNLADKSELVRRETAYALGKIQAPAAIGPLIRTFENKKEKSIEVKNAAIVALGEIGDPAAIDFLTQLLRQKPVEKDEFRRRSAARAIGQIAQIVQLGQAYTVTPESFLPEKFKLLTIEKYRDLSPEFPAFRSAVTVLTQVLQNPREADDARREAAFALGAVGDRSARPVLESQLNSKDYYLAEICKEAVKKLASVEAS